MNRRKLLSLFLSLLIHLLLFGTLFLLFHEKRLLTSTGAKKRVEISLKNFVTPPSAPKPSTPTPKPLKPQRPIPPVKPEIPRKKPTPKPEPKPAVKKPTPKPKPKPVKKPAIQKRPAPKPHPKPKKPAPKPRRKKIEKKIAPLPTRLSEKPQEASPLSGLAGALGAPAVPAPAPSRPKPPSIDQINGAMGEREFRALYKDEFDHFTPNQKRFIRSNLNRIQAITQHYLTMRGYPPFAVRQHMQGMNVVEFYLWPNGDITDLKVIETSGFSVLDDNSLDTIRTAYKDYPRPEEKTKIRFFIHYVLY